MFLCYIVSVRFNLEQEKSGNDVPAYPSDAEDCLEAIPEAKGAKPHEVHQLLKTTEFENVQRCSKGTAVMQSSRQLSLVGSKSDGTRHILRGALIYGVQPVLWLSSSCGY